MNILIAGKRAGFSAFRSILIRGDADANKSYEIVHRSGRVPQNAMADHSRAPCRRRPRRPLTAPCEARQRRDFGRALSSRVIAATGSAVVCSPRQIRWKPGGELRSPPPLASLAGDTAAAEAVGESAPYEAAHGGQEQRRRNRAPRALPTRRFRVAQKTGPNGYSRTPLRSRA
jgi:hypothetical protein